MTLFVARSIVATTLAWAAISYLRQIGNSQDLRLRNVAYSSTLLLSNKASLVELDKVEKKCYGLMDFFIDLFAAFADTFWIRRCFGYCHHSLLE